MAHKIIRLKSAMPETQEVISQIWKHIADFPAVLFDMPDANLQRQPMWAHVESDSQLLWFFSRQTSPLVQAVRSDSNVANLTVESVDQNFHAFLKGILEEYDRDESFEAKGSHAVAELYPDAINDPELAMLHFTPRSASVWAGEGSFMSFDRDIFESKNGGGQRDLSYHVEFDF